MDEANLCDELVLLHEGMILAQGNPNALLNQFPLALWSVEAARPLRWPVQNTPPSLCESMYAMGGHLHVLTKANENRGDIEKSLKHTLGDDIQISIASPLIEDLFLSLLNGVLHPSDFKALK